MTPAPAFLVTGAAGNLGRAVCAALAARGVRVAAADRDRDALTAMVAALPGDGHAAFAAADLADPAASAALLDGASSALGRLDGVAHTVGGFAMAPAHHGGAALWEGMFRLNLLTTLSVFQAAIPALRASGGGSLVAVAAGAALRAPAEMGAYAASKAAVLRLVEAMAAETAADGVRVNAVMPGVIDTPQNRAAMPDADVSRWVRPEQAAAVVAFLLGAESSGVAGAAIPVVGRG